MSETVTNTDEVDLGELIRTIWKEKWLVGATTAAALAAGAGFVAAVPQEFEAELGLSPLGVTAMLDYAELNEIGYFTMTPDRLMATLLEVLLERDVFVSEMDRLGTLDRNDFESEEQYQRTLRGMAFDIVFQRDALVPDADINLDEQAFVRGWKIRIPGTDYDATEELLAAVISTAEEITRQRLAEAFQRQAAVTRRSQANLIEDTERAISNATEDYETQTGDRLAFLLEQAQIARALGVARNTLEVNSFTQGNSIIANVSADVPFYLRGYEAIEKEIDLISSRDTPEAFIPNLRELEKTIRGAEQDPTLDRASAALSESPISDPARFTAAAYDIASLEVTSPKKTPLIFALAMVLGLFSGTVGVVLRRALGTTGGRLSQTI